MARVTLHFDSMTTSEMRAVVRALRPQQGLVGLNGPECWTFTTPAISPNMASDLCTIAVDNS